MTPHNEAKKEDIAKIVLMPGDPLRAKYIAEKFLENIKLVNSVRGMFAYTGEYRGKKVTIMAHGMGIPSIGIYTYELYKFYDVDYIIRIGSCGAYEETLKVLDTILVDNSYSESTYAKVQNGSTYNIISGSKQLNDKIKNVAKNLDLPLKICNVHSTDVFYRDCESEYKEYNCLAVEMEAFALFHNANIFNKKAACLLTVTDTLYSSDKLSAKQRETALNDMIKLALETALTIE